MKMQPSAFRAGAKAVRPVSGSLGLVQPVCGGGRTRLVQLAAGKRTGYQDFGAGGWTQGGYAAPGRDSWQVDGGSLDSLDSMDNNFAYLDDSYTPGYPQRGYRRDGGYAGNYTGRNNNYGRNHQDFLAEELEPEYDPYELPGPGSPPPPPAPDRIVNGKKMIINNEIKASSVRVIAGEGGKQQRGVMPLQEALYLARDLGVDLCLLNSESDPPLCRLVGWSKYKYEVEKTQKKKAAKANTVETKEVRLRPGTDANDLNTKLKSAQKFLEKGNKVKLVMKFEGRELQYKEQGKQVMIKFVEDLGVVGKVDGPINFKTGTYTALLNPTGRMMPVGSGKDAGADAADAALAAGAAAAAQVAAAGGALPLPPAPPAAALPLPPAPPAVANGLPLPPTPPAPAAPASLPPLPPTPPATAGLAAPPAANGVPPPPPAPAPQAAPAPPAAPPSLLVPPGQLQAAPVANGSPAPLQPPQAPAAVPPPVAPAAPPPVPAAAPALPPLTARPPPSLPPLAPPPGQLLMPQRPNAPAPPALRPSPPPPPPQPALIRPAAMPVKQPVSAQ